MESHEAGFPPFPHSLEIPSGFPHSHDLDDWRYMSSRAPQLKRCCREGLVTDVSGPQRNACPGTLTSARLVFLIACRTYAHSGSRCDREQAAEGVAEDAQRLQAGE